MLDPDLLGVVKIPFKTGALCERMAHDLSKVYLYNIQVSTPTGSASVGAAGPFSYSFLKFVNTDGRGIALGFFRVSQTAKVLVALEFFLHLQEVFLPYGRIVRFTLTKSIFPQLWLKFKEIIASVFLTERSTKA